MAIPSQKITVAVNLSGLDENANASVAAVTNQTVVGVPVIQGPAGSQGEQGPTGATGPAGPSGKTVLNGTGAPNGATGADGDFYIDTSANYIYGPKVSGAWGSGTSIVGPQGPGSGDVNGPASSTDNAIARFDSSTGKLIQNSTATLSDTADLTMGKLLKLNASTGNPEMDLQEAGTTRGKLFYDITNNQLVLQNSENGNDDAVYSADPLTVLGAITTKHTIGGNTSTYRIAQDEGDLLIIARTGDTTGDGNYWSLIDLQSPQITSDTADSESTLSLTTRNGTPSSKLRTFDLYNDEYSRDNGLGFRQLYKNTTPNPIRWEFHDKTTNNGAWTMSGVTLTNGSPNGSYTSVTGVTPSAEDWIWDNAGTYIADDTKIVSIDTGAKTFVMNRNATSGGSGLSIRGKNIKEIMRLTPSRQLLLRKVIASSSSNVAEFGGQIQVDGKIIGLTDPSSAQDAATKAYVDSGASLYRPGGTDVAVADGGTGASSASGARTNLGLVIGTDVEAHDADLTTIAGLSPSNDDVLQRKSGAWTNRTPAQLKTDLSLTKSDVGLGNVTNDAQLKSADLDTDGTLAANSDTKIPSQKAVKTYVTTGLATKETSSTWSTWTPTETGFSTAPSGGIYRYRTVGDEIELEIIEPNDGTSNASGFTISLPVTAATVSNTEWIGWANTRNNGAFVNNTSMAVIASAGTTMTLYISPNRTTTWGTTGGKRCAYLRMKYRWQ